MTDEEIITIANAAEWADFWACNAECLEDEVGDEAACLALANDFALVTGGGAAPAYRIGFAR